ncbi:hypothetical protein [Aquitalea pelogenes]|uniref:hypothetical protein n=1 Tax=Aquitalea pelogenes TaxID=1293573 RepID=UPI001EFA469D|nr:hypothetical protein [Aquitalea pelogenes]
MTAPRVGEMEITILGCGSSSGTPAIGCQCATCSSTDPRNHRTRCSAYIRCGEHGLLIDTGPDLRQQRCARASVRWMPCCTPIRTPTISTASTICAPSATSSKAR